MEPKPPSVLYHYTDANGLLGILSHKQLWLTHHSFLNDSNEIQYGKKLLKEVVPDFSESIPRDSFEDWIENFDMREERTKDQTYIACFSENGDQLSQWRAYADDGLGFAIGFHSSALEDLAGSVGWCFGPDRVIYNKGQQVKLLREAIDNGFTDNDGELIEFWDGLLDQNSITFKEAAFTEEAEWRMTSIFIAQPDAAKDEYLECPTPLFRSTKYGIAPYVQLAFPVAAIIEIVIGPRCPMREKHWVIRQILRHHDVESEIKITNSKATYR